MSISEKAEEKATLLRSLLVIEMRKSGLGQVEIAKRAGTSQSTVARLWAGQAMPGLAEFIAYCWVLGLNPTEVLQSVDTRLPKETPS